MKVGEEVTLACDFLIAGIFPATKIVAITLLNSNYRPTETIQLPLYLDFFGISPGQVYVKPSNSLPLDHPDYYEMSADGPIWPPGNPCDIKLDEKFRENGRYKIFVTIKDKTEVIHRTASRIDDIFWRHVEKECKDIVGKSHDIRGRIVGIYYFVGNEVATLPYITEQEVELSRKGSVKVLVEVHQANGNVMFLNAYTIKNAS